MERTKLSNNTFHEYLPFIFPSAAILPSPSLPSSPSSLSSSSSSVQTSGCKLDRRPDPLLIRPVSRFARWEWVSKKEREREREREKETKGGKRGVTTKQKLVKTYVHVYIPHPSITIDSQVVHNYTGDQQHLATTTPLPPPKSSSQYSPFLLSFLRERGISRR